MSDLSQTGLQDAKRTWGRGDIVAAGAVVLVAAALHWQFVLLGRIPLNTDWLIHHFEPWRSALDAPPPHNPELDDPAILHFPLWQSARRIMRAGHWPLWNPHILCGTPLLADTMSNPFDPVNLLTLPLPDDVAWGLVILMQFAIAGLGTYVYLRGMGLSRAACAAAGVCCMLNGFFIVWMELRFVVACFCWTPWALFCMDRTARTLKLRWAVAVGLLYAFQVFSGNLHHVFNLTLFMVAYAVFRLWEVGRSQGAARLRRAAGALALGLVFGVCLSAPQWAATYELTSLCSRSPYKYRSFNALHLLELIAFVAPKFYGHPADGDFVGARFFVRSYLTMNSGYVGAFALPFLLLGALCSSKRAAKFFAAAGLGVIAFLLALGVGPLHRALASVMAIDTLDHHRLIVLPALCAAMLVGFGFDFLAARGPGKPSWPARAAAGAGIAGAAAALAVAAAFRAAGCGDGQGFTGYLRELQQGRGLFVFAPQALPALLLLAAGSVTAWCWLSRPASRVLAGTALLCLAGELLYFGSQYNPYVPREKVYPRTRSIDFLRAQPGRFRILGVERADAHRWKGDVIPPSSGLCYAIDDVRGKEGMYPLRTRRFMESLKRRRDVAFAALVHFTHCDSAVFDLLNAKYVLADRELRRPHLRRVFDGELHVYENERCLPRAFTCSRAIVFERETDLVRYMHEDGFDPRAAVLLDSPPEAVVGTAQSTESAHVAIVSDEPNRVVVSVAAPSACYLVLADTNFPGWRAKLDGRPAIVQNAYYLLRCVSVPQGRHTIVFEYWPVSFEVGLFLSVGALAALLAAGLASGLRGVRKAQRDR